MTFRDNWRTNEHQASLRRMAQNAVPCRPLLPLTHITGASTLQKIVASTVVDTELRNSECEVYKEKLVYLFYDRPAYRPFNGPLATSLPEFRPVCFLLKPTAAVNIARIVALDSGAFVKGYYRRHHGDAINLGSFEIGDKVPDAARFVTGFFGSNLAYYLGDMRPDLQISPIDLVANSYRSIVSDKGLTKIDDRRGPAYGGRTSTIVQLCAARRLPRMPACNFASVLVAMSRWLLRYKQPDFLFPGCRSACFPEGDVSPSTDSHFVACRAGQRVIVY